MKVNLLEDIMIGNSPVLAGIRDIHQVIAQGLINQGKAVLSDAPVEVAPEPEKETALDKQAALFERIDELRENYTVPELRDMVKKITGKKPHGATKEKALASIIAESEAKG